MILVSVEVFRFQVRISRLPHTAQVTVDGSVTAPASASNPCVRVSQHTAPEYAGCCHQHSLNRYQNRPLGKCTVETQGFHYAQSVCHKALAFTMYLYHPEYPPSVSISPALPGALASEGILPAGACGWLPAQSKLRAISGLLRSVD